VKGRVADGVPHDNRANARPFGVLLLLMVGVLCCTAQVHTGNFAENRRIAEEAMSLFHARLGDGRAEEAYAVTDAGFRAAASPADQLAEMKTIHDRFGSFVACDVRAAACFVDQVRLVTHTQYSKAKTTELFMWTVREGSAKLSKFSISPGLAEVRQGVGNECR